MTQFVQLVEMEIGIVSVEISRPDALNALNQQVLQQLNQIVQSLKQRQDLSVVILKTSGEKAFVAGADIKEMLNFSAAEALAFARFGQQVFNDLNNLPQVVIAQVQGFALGGGLELALAADFIISSDNAKFGLPEVGLGLIPGFGGTQRLVRRLGYARALEWMTSAGRYDSSIAYSFGLLNQVVSREELSNVVRNVAGAINEQGPQAVRAAKECARAALQTNGDLGFEIEARTFSQRFGQSEAREGLQAFLEKRKPKFRG